MAGAPQAVRKASDRALALRWRRRLAAVSAVLAFGAVPAQAASKSSKPHAKAAAGAGRHGDANGQNGLLGPNPHWSVGAQLGTGDGTGIEGQYIGLYNGAVNFGLGIGDTFVLHGDYIALFGTDFHLLSLTPAGGYNAIRGKITPYVGAGAQYGDGLSLRAPIGVQYVMNDHPVNFFGAVVILAGPIIGGSTGMGVGFNASIGARVLL